MYPANLLSTGKLAYVAEDDPFLASMMEQILQEHGVEVRVARNGEETVDLIREELPQLLLLDLLMPKADGYHVLAFIHENHHVFPVVIVTNASLDAEKRGELRVADIIIKSDLDEDEIWNRIERFFE